MSWLMEGHESKGNRIGKRGRPLELEATHADNGKALSNMKDKSNTTKYKIRGDKKQIQSCIYSSLLLTRYILHFIRAVF